MSPILSDILTSEVVAELLACEPSTVEEAARNKDLPAVKYGRGWVFPKEAFLAHINAKALSNLIKEVPAPTGVLLDIKKKKQPPTLPNLEALLPKAVG